MNDKNLEKISATIDNELDHEELEQLFGQIETDQQAKASWQRYNLIGDAMRHTLPKKIDPKMAERISQRLQDEPTIIVKKASQRKKNLIKPLGGLAIAASVSVVAILILNSVAPLLPSLAPEDVDGNLAMHPTEIDNTTSFDSSNTEVRTVQYKPMVNPEQKKRINSYILNHNQFNSRMGISGGAANVRLVRHEDKK